MFYFYDFYVLIKVSGLSFQIFQLLFLGLTELPLIASEYIIDLSQFFFQWHTIDLVLSQNYVISYHDHTLGPRLALIPSTKAFHRFRDQKLILSRKFQNILNFHHKRAPLKLNRWLPNCTRLKNWLNLNYLALAQTSYISNSIWANAIDQSSVIPPSGFLVNWYRVKLAKPRIKWYLCLYDRGLIETFVEGAEPCEMSKPKWSQQVTVTKESVETWWWHSKRIRENVFLFPLFLFDFY